MVSSFCRKLLNQSKLACSLLWISYLLYTMQCCWNREWSRLSSFTLCPSLSSTCSPVQSKHTLSDQGYILVSTCFSIFLELETTIHQLIEAQHCVSTGLCLTFLIEVVTFRFTTYDIEQQTWIVNCDRSLFVLLAAIQLLHSIFTYRYMQWKSQEYSGRRDR